MLQTTWKTYNTPQPLAQYFVSLAGGFSDPPKSLRSLWPMLGYMPKRGVRERSKNEERWKKVFVNAPHFAEWVKSSDGLRAPRRWPQAIEDSFYEQDVHIPPISFAAACFPGRGRVATLYTHWRGMPELCAAAHGWELEREEEQRAVDAVRSLSLHVPFVVYAHNPSLRDIPYPESGGSIMRCLEARARFEADPLGCTPTEVSRAIDVQRWPATVVRSLPRRAQWSPRTTRVPEERSLVEAGVGGWKPIQLGAAGP